MNSWWRAYTRARELWERLGSPAELHHVPYGQSFYHAARGELDLAQRLDEDFLRLSRQRNDLGGLALAYLCSGRNCMFAGKFAVSRLELEKVLALYDPVFHHALVHQVRLDPRVGSQTHLGIVLFCLGYPDQASARSKAAITEARRLAHPASLAPSLSLNCMQQPRGLKINVAVSADRCGTKYGSHQTVSSMVLYIRSISDL